MMQSTVRDTQPVSWSDIDKVISMNPHRNMTLDPIRGECAESVKDIDADAVNWMPAGWTYADSSFLATPISIALMASDPLYEISATNVRRSLEKEGSTELAEKFDDMYSKHGGRTRGWAKTAMNSELTQWAAGATERPFDWTALLDKRKILSALLDITCVKYGIRIAIWWSQHKKLSLWPLQESVDDVSWESAPIINIEVLTSGEAHVLVNPDGDIKVKAASWLNLFKTIGEWQWTRPATAPTIGTRTLAELKEEYGMVAGEKALASLPKKIDKDSVAVLIYKHEWVEGRLLQKEQSFY
jgi:hypothetical protein